MSHYNVGRVKPHVKPVADAVGHKFNVSTVYGYAFRNIEGTSKLSDHARGLALDFMTYTDMAKGQRVANYVLANAGALNVKYIIWNRQIWQPGRGWTRHTGNPHLDHVHVSFTASGSFEGTPTGESPGSPSVNSGASLGLFTQTGTWVRVGMFVGGVVLILVALMGMAGKQMEGIIA